MHGVTASRPLVATGVAARALGVDVRTLQRWVQNGDIEPDYTTPGGHHRWNVERVREALRGHDQQP